MIVINGQKPLSGSITISGSKNASAPLIAAGLLFDSATIHNVPDIDDNRYLLQIVESMGVTVERKGSTVSLKWDHPSYETLERERMNKMRVSILLLPAMLARFGKASMPYPGGCNIGKRPIDEHIDGLKALGYTEGDEVGAVSLKGSPMSGDVHLRMNTMVTATENLILAAVMRNGTTYLHDSAYEPPVVNLVESLRSAGANIEMRYDHTIIVRGGIDRSIPREFTVVSDYLESGTWAVIAALASEKYLDIQRARIGDLGRFLSKMSQM